MIETLTYSEVLDMPEQEFKDLILTQDIGILTGTMNMIKSSFNQAYELRNDLNKVISNRTKKNINVEEEMKLYTEVYQLMMKLELKVFILKEEIEKRNKQLSDNLSQKVGFDEPDPN